LVIATILRYVATVFTLDLNDLNQALLNATGQAPSKVEPMPGGASSRKFFRAQMPSGTRYVAMFVPDLAKSDEIDKKGTPRRWPFLEVRDLLAERAVRVPSLVIDYTQCGWTVVEDLGPETIAEHLQAHPQRKLMFYKTAVRDLAMAHRALEKLPQDSVVRTRAFDFDLLRWEIEHFREWGLDALGRALSPAARGKFDAVGDKLAKRIAELPRSFVHRDYQSRNLMVISASDEVAELGWVDFQDALMGPRVYDLVALLNDSYQVFERSFVEDRLREFAQILGFNEGQTVELIHHFDLVTVQRKLKDAGRFVFIDRKKGDSSYLKFVDPTLAKVKVSLDRLSDDSDMQDLAEILRPIFPV
jgi:hypothetical protein